MRESTHRRPIIQPINSLQNLLPAPPHYFLEQGAHGLLGVGADVEHVGLDCWEVVFFYYWGARM